MISRNTAEKISALLMAIEEAGLTGLVAENAYFILLKKLADTGADLPAWVEQTDEETERSAEVYSMIQYWGVGTDEATKRIWQDFTISWHESLLNRGKAR